MNIVIRSPNWIGDCIMSLPAVRALKDNRPQDDIILVAREHLCDVYQNIREIKNIVPLANTIDFLSTFKAAKKLKTFGFDAGILFTNSFNSALLFRIAGIKQLIGYSRDCRSFLLSHRIKFPRSDKHHVFFYLDLIQAFVGTEITKEYPDELSVSQDEKEKVGRVLAKFGVDSSKSLIGISPCAAYGSAKQWPPQGFRELIDRLKQEKKGWKILLFGSGNERAQIAGMVEGWESSSGIYNLAGALTLREAIAAISLCKVFVSNDSGLMHIASSLKIPLVSIFGPTLPHKTAPLYRGAKVLHHPVGCAPCTYRDCPLDHRCMTAITVDKVYDTVIKLFHDKYE